jgi:GntR family transcriptional regulator of vanillate catabolism
MSGQTVTQTSTDRVRAMVLDGELQPGSRLQERQLAASLGVSRTPIRDTLQLLAGEGLLEYSPHSGYVVRRFDLGEVIDAFDTRLALEGMACRTLALRGVERATADALIDNLERSESLINPEGWNHEVQRRWYERNLEFHDLILEAVGNRYLMQGVGQARRIPLIYDTARRRHGLDDLLSLLTYETFRQAVADHRRIVDALLAAQPDRAEFLMREHIFTSREALRRNADVWERGDGEDDAASTAD